MRKKDIASRQTSKELRAQRECVGGMSDLGRIPIARCIVLICKYRRIICFPGKMKVKKLLLSL